MVAVPSTHSIMFHNTPALPIRRRSLVVPEALGIIVVSPFRAAWNRFSECLATLAKASSSYAILCPLDWFADLKW